MLKGRGCDCEYKEMLSLFLLVCLGFVATHAALISLQPQNVPDLQQLFVEVSDPLHPNYLGFLSADELHDRFAPSQLTIEWIGQWLQQPYSLVAGRRWQLRTAGDVTRPIPSKMSNFILGVINSNNTSSNGTSPIYGQFHSFSGPNGPSYVVPVAQTLATIYNAPDPRTYQTNNPLRVTVVSLGDPYLPSDLTAYSQVMGMPLNPVININLTLNSAGQGETSLDMDMVASVAPPGTTITYRNNYQSAFSQWCIDILNSPSDSWPHLATLSWGETELVSYPPEEESNTCFQLLGLGGVSMVTSSGDDGAWGFTNTDCDPTYGYAPSFPATSPYVTGVGATTFPVGGMYSMNAFPGVPLCDSTQTIAQLGQTYGFAVGSYSAMDASFQCATGKSGPEVAVSTTTNGFESGGGFSLDHNASSWQQPALRTYFSNPTTPFPNPTLWNVYGRGFPDVSMYGAGGVVMHNGALTSLAGTSQSAPLFAAFMAYIVDWFLTYQGRPPGFLNPLLYYLFARNPLVFNDVVSGTNNGTRYMTAAQCRVAGGGFTTAKGWDAVTGLGTPNIALMLEELQLMFSDSSTGLYYTPSTASPTMMPSSSSPSTPSLSLPSWAYSIIAVGVVAALFAVVVVLSHCRVLRDSYTAV